MEPIEFADSDTVARKDRWPLIRRWLRIAAAVLAVALVIAAAIAGFHFGPRAYDYLRPYARLYAPKPVSDTAVVPLFDLDTKFDVAVTVWQRDNVTLPSHGGTSHGRTFYLDSWQYQVWREGGGVEKMNANETVLFSQVVFRDFSLRSDTLKTTIGFEIQPYRSMSHHEANFFPIDIRAAVTFNPRSPSPLDHVSKYTSAMPVRRVFPAANSEELLATGEWGEPSSIRRRLLDSLTVHVPLSRLHSWYGPHVVPRHHVVNSTHVYMINETHPFKRDEWLSGFNQLRTGGGFCNGGWLTCDESERDEDGRFYATKGHFLGKSELGGEGQSARLAYSPFMGSLPPVHGHTVRRPVIAPPSPEDYPHNWYYDDDNDDWQDPSDAHPLRINLTLQLSVLDAARQRARLFVTKKVARYNFHGYRGERERKVEHDIWAFSSEPLVAPHEVEGFIFWISLTADGLIGNPIAGAHVWRRIVLVAIHKLLGVAVALLTPLYWYTRKTSAGLSLWSIWTRVLVVVPSSIHYVATTQIDFIRDLTLMWWIVVALQCVGEYLQLRLVCPLDLRTARLGVTDRGGGVVQRVEERGSGVDIDFKLSLDGVFERRKWTHRERDTMRLEPSWKVAVGTFIACFVFCYACRGWIIAPAMPRGHDRTTQDSLAMFAKALGWAGYTCANILQIRMNHYAGTFAGTYALVAYLQIGVEVCEVLYNFSLVMGEFYVINGLSVFEASRVVFSLAVLAQAVTLPRVEQEGGE